MPANTSSPVLRDRREYLHTPLLGGVELLAAEYRQHVFPRHVQDQGVIGLVEAGHIRFIGGGIDAEIGDGDVLFIAPGTVHEAAGDGDGAWGYRAIYLTPAQWVSSCAALGAAPPTDAAIVHNDRLYGRAWRAHRDLVSGILAERRFEEVIRSLMAAVVEQKHQPTGTGSREVESGLTRVRLALDSATTRRMTVPEMVALSGLGRFRFLHEFSRVYGVSPYAYSLNRRLLEAQRRLAAGAPISLTALEVGFADQAHLTRHFLRTIGVTPGEYQKAYTITAASSRGTARAAAP